MSVTDPKDPAERRLTEAKADLDGIIGRVSARLRELRDRQRRLRDEVMRRLDRESAARLRDRTFGSDDGGS